MLVVGGLGFILGSPRFLLSCPRFILNPKTAHTKVSRGCEPKNSKGCEHLFQCLFSYKIQSNSD